jgi:hypothetical protein
VVGGSLFSTTVLTYLVPLHTADDDDIEELATYLRVLAEHVDVLVVDGSSDWAISRHRFALGSRVRLMRTEHRTLMGKVGNTLTGLRYADHDKIVIADDDVRYTHAHSRTSPVGSMRPRSSDPKTISPRHHGTRASTPRAHCSRASWVATGRARSECVGPGLARPGATRAT